MCSSPKTDFAGDIQAEAGEVGGCGCHGEGAVPGGRRGGVQGSSQSVSPPGLTVIGWIAVGRDGSAAWRFRPYVRHDPVEGRVPGQLSPGGSLPVNQASSLSRMNIESLATRFTGQG